MLLSVRTILAHGRIESQDSRRRGGVWATMPFLLPLVFIIAACGTDDVDDVTDDDAAASEQPAEDDDGAADESTEEQESGEPLSFAIAHPFTQDSSLGAAVEALTSHLEENYAGDVDVTHGHSGALGAEAEGLEAIQVGTLEMAIVTNAVMVTVDPEYAILELPYLFEDFDHQQEALQLESIVDLYSDSEDYGYKWLDHWWIGERAMFGNTAIRTVDDLEGVRIRILPSPVFIETFEAWGAVPTPIAWPEVYNALELGTVDAGETNPISVADANLYEVIDYLTVTDHSYSLWNVIVNPDWWNSLDESAQMAIEDAVAVARVVNDEAAVEGNRVGLQTIEDAGVEIIRPDPAPFREVAVEQWPDSVPSELIDEVLSLR